MTKADFTTLTVALFLAAGLTVGCDRPADKSPTAAPKSTASHDHDDGSDHTHDHAETTPTAPKAVTTEDPHAGHDHSQHETEPTPAAPQAKTAEGARLTLTGLTMQPDPEWTAAPVGTGSMAPVAVFALPVDPAGGTPVEIRITHYPAMKGPKMDELNIKRWVKSVRRADGTPATVEDAKVTVKTVGHIRLTIVDITGTAMPTMGEQAEGLSGQRLIAAIVDHPEGPHFVKALGPATVIAKWEERILTFLDSAAVAP